MLDLHLKHLGSNADRGKIKNSEQNYFLFKGGRVYGANIGTLKYFVKKNSFDQAFVSQNF